jgi:hypothetical protein
MSISIKSSILFCVFILAGATSVFAQALFTIRGKVTDAVSGEPLVAANVRVLGTSRGTISNTQGIYSLSLDAGTYTLVYSYLAYQSDTFHVDLNVPVTHDVKLNPSPIQMPEVIVVAEDPAIDIIRKAIAHKHEWMEKLKSYRFDAFTRQVLRRDTAIASITESYSTGYMIVGDTLREIVTQKRQTENIPGSDNFAAVHRIINFNEDIIKLFDFQVNNRASSFAFVGPTAPDALEYYDYKLLNTSTSNGVEMYTIRMIPKSRLRPLFDGTIIIADRTFAVVSVDVKPNETLTFPFIKDLELRYKQQFGLYDSIFWMPVDNRISGSLQVSVIGISMPAVAMDFTSSIYDYGINVEIPDSILHKRKLTVDSSATKIDSAFWTQHEVLPLTPEEQHAYETLDSSQTLDKQFKPTGPLMALSDDDGAGSFLKYIDFRFNRVEGFFTGGKYEIDTLLSLAHIEGAAGYGYSDKRFKYSLGATLYTSRTRTLGFGANIYNTIDNTPDGEYYGSLAISLMSLIDKNDYRDYFMAKGWRTFIEYKPFRWLNSTLSFLDERHSSMRAVTNYSLFGQEKAYRENPEIAEGQLRSFRLEARFGDSPVPLDIVPRRALEVSIEYSSPDLAKSDYTFTQISAKADYNITTFASSLLFPPTLKVRVSAGTSIDSLPPQRTFMLDRRSSGYSPLGVLHGLSINEFRNMDNKLPMMDRGCDRFVMVTLEHNFRSIPFLALNIPFLYRSGVEFIVFGSAAQSWHHSVSITDGWYSEAGFGINKIFDLLRADITYRTKNPQRFYFTLSVANIF